MTTTAFIAHLLSEPGFPRAAGMNLMARRLQHREIRSSAAHLVKSLPLVAEAPRIGIARHTCMA
jgi:hypothetical protein